MSQETQKTQEGEIYWVGIDWGGESHAVTVVNEQRMTVKQFTVSTQWEGIELLMERLHAVGRIAGVAIESTRDRVVACLSNDGFTVYPINPKMSKNWRDGVSVNGSKSDERDGHVLAVELSRRHEALRVLKRDDDTVAELGALCRSRRDLLDERTALVQCLRAKLKDYYPYALDFFKDWTSPVAWRFLKKFPTVQKLAGTREETLKNFLRANKVGIRPYWEKRIDARTEGLVWPTLPEHQASQFQALAIVAQLLALQPHIKKLEDAIDRCAGELSETELIRSLPGAGKQLTPAITAIVTGAAAQEGGYEAVRKLGGVAPIQGDSGKRKKTQIRRRCDKHWRTELHLFAFSSMRRCAWAKAFYDRCRERKDSHATALRKLADKWLKIIMAMLAKREPYDEQKHLKEMKKHNSPTYQKLCGQTGG